MTWVFWAMIIIALILFWFLIAGLFKPVGKVSTKIVQDALDKMNEYDETEKEKEKEKEESEEN